ncbi:hypothetical protein H0H92_004343 [Tricholoma furcatifolium]|nr:hypothetical protein H0H92_004343 [Tricholoma furcatifolium]
MHCGAPSSSVAVRERFTSHIRRRSGGILHVPSANWGVQESRSLDTIEDCDTQENSEVSASLPSIEDVGYPSFVRTEQLPEFSTLSEAHHQPAIPEGESFQFDEYEPSPYRTGTRFTSSRSSTMMSCKSFSPIIRPRVNSRKTLRSMSGYSIDSGRKSLIPSIATTEKFTDKWPAPVPLRRIFLLNFPDAMERDASQSAIAALESGEALCEDKQKWTAFKWCMLVSVLTILIYGSTGLACAVITWFRGWEGADVLRIIDYDILIVITLTASMMVFTSLVGICGVFLNSRPLLALYTLLLWPVLVSLAAIGYTSYHRVTFALDHKLNLTWSRYVTPLGRLLVQDALECCGYSSSLHSATLSNRCYARTPLPGCKARLLRFERENLARIWMVAFSIALLHLCNIVVSLLCANHLTDRFGRGITPKQYRLKVDDVRAEAERILAELQVDRSSEEGEDGDDAYDLKPCPLN